MNQRDKFCTTLSEALYPGTFHLFNIAHKKKLMVKAGRIHHVCVWNQVEAIRISVGPSQGLRQQKLKVVRAKHCNC